MLDDFFERPILNSPYESPRRHWELVDGQPTQKILENRRRADFITPIPKPKKRKATPKQGTMVFDEGKGLSDAKQQYDPTPIINEIRNQVADWRALPNPSQWQVTPGTARLLQHWRHHDFGDVRPFFCQVEAMVSFEPKKRSPGSGDVSIISCHAGVRNGSHPDAIKKQPSASGPAVELSAQGEATQNPSPAVGLAARWPLATDRRDPLAAGQGTLLRQRAPASCIGSPSASIANAAILPVVDAADWETRMSGRMAGKVAIVTGGGGGIGGATGELFCAEGGKVLLVDRDADALQQTAYRIADRVAGAEVEVMQADVSELDHAAAVVDRVVARFNGLDVLVNNAAIRNIARIEATERQVWNSVLGVNLIGAVNFCKAAAPALRASGKGAVINVSSVYGVVGRADWAIYDATKAALLALTRTFAIEEAPNGVRVNAICVGGTLTPYTVGRAKTRGLSEEDLRRQGRQENLLKRWGEPMESAYPILWLASDEASFVTGATLMVDGGRSVL